MTTPTPSRQGLARHVLESDPVVSYLLHVPTVRSDEPRMVVSIHGASRNVDGPNNGRFTNGPEPTPQTASV